MSPFNLGKIFRDVTAFKPDTGEPAEKVEWLRQNTGLTWRRAKFQGSQKVELRDKVLIPPFLTGKLICAEGMNLEIHLYLKPSHFLLYSKTLADYR